jgi:hypothetical protein
MSDLIARSCAEVWACRLFAVLLGFIRDRTKLSLEPASELISIKWKDADP